jgi:D-serine deaminase-like pyridoxal phosphate-dependent protein
VAEAREVADAVRASDRLRLAGCGGYEGALAHDRGTDGLARVAAYLDALVEFHDQLAAADAYEAPIPIVTVGGSAYLDQVADRLAPVVGSATVLVRAGAYVIHDDGFYRDISPLDHGRFEGGLRSAMHGWVRVVSRPEPDLAILDGGKRDFPVDEGLPTPQLVTGLPREESDALLAGSTITALNDQHAFLRLAAGTSAAALPVGTVIRLGLSHPCTALDKWRALPVIESSDGADGDAIVTGFVRTHF